MTEMRIIREKQVLRDVLEKYRDLPVLWNQSHELYGNKLARKEGYARLLESYKLCDPDMTFHELKKKLENMRTTYRRERVKVLRSQVDGKEEYVPTLWYYNLYTFLDDIVDGSNSRRRKRSRALRRDDEEESEEEEDEEMSEVEEDYVKVESRSNSPPPEKKPKSNLILLPESDHEPTESYSMDNGACSQVNQDTSTASFGKTIGLQLSELNPLQRYIAEKLISDVIFYGRLEKLQPSTTLNINNNDY